MLGDDSPGVSYIPHHQEREADSWLFWAIIARMMFSEELYEIQAQAPEQRTGCLVSNVINVVSLSGAEATRSLPIIKDSSSL